MESALTNLGNYDWLSDIDWVFDNYGPKARAAGALATNVLHCDGYFRLKEIPLSELTTAKTNAKKHLYINSKLPLELQKLIANYSQGIATEPEKITNQEFEAAVRRIAPCA